MPARLTPWSASWTTYWTTVTSRRLDQKGVVSPSRSEGKQRRYTRREVTVVQYVVQLADQGVSLAGIRRILELETQVRRLEQECAALRAQLRRYQEQEED